MPPLRCALSHSPARRYVVATWSYPDSGS